MLWICVPVGMLRSGKRITNADRRVRTGHDRIADFQSDRRKHVPLFAIRIKQQRDPRGAVWIVFNGGHRAGIPILVPLEVNDSIEALVATTLMPDCNAAMVVPTGLLLERLDQTFLRRVFR